MAVYTEVTDADLQAFLADFDLGPPTAFKGIAEGVENTNYLLQTAKGGFFLTLYEKRVAKDDLPFFIACLRHLADKGVACPQPVADRDGVILKELCGKPAALMTLLPGLSPKRPNAVQCGEAGSALARLHMAGADFGQARANSMGPGAWRKLVAATRDKADRVQTGLAAILDEELAHAVATWPQGLPSGLIHADLFPDNVLFSGDRITGLIDFYFACTDPYVYDVAVCLNSWCFESDGAYNFSKGRALLACYQAIRPLSPAERAALPNMARASALRFLLTRLFDWLNRDPTALVRPKDPLEFLGRLRFHRAARDSAAYGI
jgi:homoserine kinase type II